MRHKKTGVVLHGSTGMLGSYLSIILEEYGYNVILPRFDATAVDQHDLETLLRAADASTCINCIGVIKQRDLPETLMRRVNGVFVHDLAHACEQAGIDLIHFSTDCVFSGKRGKYSELDAPDATDAYGVSKREGEPASACVVRTSVIGSERGRKLSLLEWLKRQKRGVCEGYTNFLWNGVTALQLAVFVEMLLREAPGAGLIHYFSPRDISKHDLLVEMSTAYSLEVGIRARAMPESLDRTLRSIHGPRLVPDIREQLVTLRKFDERHKFL